MRAEHGTYTMMTTFYSGRIQQGFSESRDLPEGDDGGGARRKEKDEETGLSITVCPHFRAG